MQPILLPIALVAIGLGGLAVAAAAPGFRFAGVLLAVFCLFAAATALSQAGRSAVGLQQYLGQHVHMHIWGAHVPEAADATFRLVSVRAFGAGLLFRLAPTSGGKAALLKVAQPKSVSNHLHSIEIGDAAYVQWAGARVPRVQGTVALRLQIIA